jgi:hypothetical protein
VDTSEWVGVPVLGNLPPERVEEKLRQMGETADAERVEHAAAAVAKAAFLPASWWPFADRPWQYVTHQFGFVPPAARRGGTPVHLRDAGAVPPDQSLKGARVKITLDTLRAARYPDGDEHNVLFDFYARGQAAGEAEHLHFSMNLRVRNGEFSGVSGRPIFVGLPVGGEGLNFKCFTVNVASAEDEKFLGFLDSDAFRGGLWLVAAQQPAAALFSATAQALTRQIAARHRNVPAQDFCLSLDFSGNPARAALAEGTYVVVQGPGDAGPPWKWGGWLLLPGGQLVTRADQATLPPFDYLLFTLTRFAGD